jgi:hypothetical protein
LLIEFIWFIQKRKEIEKPDRAYSDDEGIKENVELGKEFRQKYPYGKLRFGLFHQ